MAEKVKYSEDLINEMAGDGQPKTKDKTTGPDFTPENTPYNVVSVEYMGRVMFIGKATKGIEDFNKNVIPDKIKNLLSGNVTAPRNLRIWPAPTEQDMENLYKQILDGFEKDFHELPYGNRD